MDPHFEGGCLKVINIFFHISVFQCSPPMRRPSAIVVNNRDEIFVKDDICIRKFDRTGASICDIGKNFFHRPYGKCITH